MTSALRLRPFPGPSVSPSVQSCDCSAGFALRLGFRSELAPLASAQPSCRLPAPAVDAGLAPFVSCHSFRPAFWPASLQRICSRFCAFVLKRPSGMPLTLRRFRLAPAAPSGPRAGFQSLRPPPALRRSAFGLCLRRLLRPYGLRLLRLPTPTGLWTTGLSIRIGLAPPANPPSRLLPPASGLRLAPLWNRPLSPASASPLSLKLGSRLTSTCRVFRSGWTLLRAPILPVPSETVLEARAPRPALPDSPSGVRPPVQGSRPALSTCPSSLPSHLPSDFRPPVSAPAPPRARSAI